MGVLRELLEEKCEQSVYVLASSDTIADRASTVGVACIYGLIEEDNRSIRVPRIWIVDNVQLIVDTGWTKLQEKTCQRTTSRSSVEP